MALIKCKQCGSLISDKATRCPKCGNVVINERPAVLYEEEDQKSGFRKYLPYLLGAVVVIGIAGYFLFNHSSKDSSYEDNGARTVAVDTVSTDVDSSDQSPKEEIAQSLGMLFDDVMKGDSHEYNERYFSSDFNRIYKEVDAIDKRFAQEGYIGFWDFGFWDMAQDEVKMSVALNDVYNIEDNEAMAKVTFRFTSSGHTEIKNEDIKVILENGKWVLDDVHNYKKQMKAFVEENKEVNKEKAYEAGVNCSLTGEVSSIENVKMVLRGKKGTLTYVMDGKRIISDIVLDEKASDIDKDGFGHLVLKSFTQDGKLKGRFVGEMDSAECGYLFEGTFVNVNGGSTSFFFSEE